MSYLLRVELPDVPGSLGRLATAIGMAGGDIGAIEIVEHGSDGVAVDDVFLETDGTVMPDSIVSACNALAGVKVLWISRYAAGSNLTRDLEVVEEMTSDPVQSLNRLVELIPVTFVVDWAMRARRIPGGLELVHGTTAAPSSVPPEISWPSDLAKGRRIDAPGDWGWLVAACPLGEDEVIVIARHGGPEILDSEIARLNHLVALASSISRASVG